MEEKEFLHFSMDNALEVVIVFDENGIIKYANRIALDRLEYDNGINGMLVEQILPGTFYVKDGAPFLEKGLFGEMLNVMAYRKNQTCFPMQAKFIHYDNHYMCMWYDISNDIYMEKQISRIENEAKEAMKVKSEFVANVTHELRTPVNGILGNVRALIEQEQDRDKLKLLNLVERGCRDMNSIINNILDFSKLEAGKFVLEPRKFNFRNMIDYVKGNHQHRITEKGLEFTVSVSPEIPEEIVGDELRIVQVLNNLISNAYKFTSIGRIHVEVVKTAVAGNRMELFVMVRDTGIGISREDQEKLFKSFSQVDASISRKYGGTGLGLNISKQLVELMGGTINVESNPGKGSVFSFDIWVEIPETGISSQEYTVTEKNIEPVVSNGDKHILDKLKHISESFTEEKEAVMRYGTPENIDEIDKKMSKLILCMEMENWEKAEMFAEAIKQLIADGPKEVQSAMLRLKMAVQKGNYEKAIEAYERFKERCSEDIGS